MSPHETSSSSHRQNFWSESRSSRANSRSGATVINLVVQSEKANEDKTTKHNHWWSTDIQARPQNLVCPRCGYNVGTISKALPAGGKRSGHSDETPPDTTEPQTIRPSLSELQRSDARVSKPLQVSNLYCSTINRAQLQGTAQPSHQFDPAGTICSETRLRELALQNEQTSPGSKGGDGRQFIAELSQSRIYLMDQKIVQNMTQCWERFLKLRLGPEYDSKVSRLSSRDRPLTSKSQSRRQSMRKIEEIELTNVNHTPTNNESRRESYGRQSATQDGVPAGKTILHGRSLSRIRNSEQTEQTNVNRTAPPSNNESRRESSCRQSVVQNNAAARETILHGRSFSRIRNSFERNSQNQPQMPPLPSEGASEPPPRERTTSNDTTNFYSIISQSQRCRVSTANQDAPCSMCGTFHDEAKEDTRSVAADYGNARRSAADYSNARRSGAGSGNAISTTVDPGNARSTTGGAGNAGTRPSQTSHVTQTDRERGNFKSVSRKDTGLTGPTYASPTIDYNGEKGQSEVDRQYDPGDIITSEEKVKQWMEKNGELGTSPRDATDGLTIIEMGTSFNLANGEPLVDESLRESIDFRRFSLLSVYERNSPRNTKVSFERPQAETSNTPMVPPMSQTNDDVNEGDYENRVWKWNYWWAK